MEGYGWFGAAYFIYDIWSMYKIHTQRLADKFLQKMKCVRKDDEHARRYCSANNNNNNNEPNSEQEEDASSTQNGTTAKNGNPSFVVKPLVNGQGKEALPVKCNGGNSFISYVISQPIMLFHHLFVGTVGFLVVTVSIFNPVLFICALTWTFSITIFAVHTRRRSLYI